MLDLNLQYSDHAHSLNSSKSAPSIMSSASASSVSLQEEMSGDSSEVSLADRSLSGSQSLFNIYFLGQAKVDRRCNSAMMPWIIEELKLKADEMKFIWLSPGIS